MDINIEFMSYKDFKEKGSEEVIKDVVRSPNKIIIINKKLKPEEEIALIEEAMKHITGRETRGIEIASISQDEEKYALISKLKSLLGKDEGITLIGNANLIKRIKRNKSGALLKI